MAEWWNSQKLSLWNDFWVDSQKFNPLALQYGYQKAWCPTFQACKQEVSLYNHTEEVDL